MTAPKKNRLDAVVRERFTLSWGEARERIERGKIFVDGSPLNDIAAEIRADARLDYVPDAKRPRLEDELLPPQAIRAFDRDIVVVDKPADLLTVPFHPGDKPTLDQLVRAVLARRDPGSPRARRAARPRVYVVHRLDRGTSGLLVFARTILAEQGLKEQFRVHSVHRRYIALVHGRIFGATFESHLTADRGDGLRGSVEKAPPRQRRKLGEGKRAVTHVEVLETFADATLVSCRLETGRTNQIRIHMSEAGHPIVGEKVYLRDYTGRALPAPRLLLHAAELGFVHPRTGEALRFSSELPAAMVKAVAGLRR